MKQVNSIQLNGINLKRNPADDGYFAVVPGLLRGVLVAEIPSYVKFILRKFGAPYPADVHLSMVDSAHVKIAFSMPNTKDSDPEWYEAKVFRRFQMIPRVLGSKYPRFAYNLEGQLETFDCFVVMAAKMFDEVIEFIRKKMEKAKDVNREIERREHTSRYLPDHPPLRNVNGPHVPPKGDVSSSTIGDDLG